MRVRIIYIKKKIINNYTFLPFFLRHVRDMHNVLLFWKKKQSVLFQGSSHCWTILHSTSIYVFYIKYRVYNKISLNITCLALTLPVSYLRTISRKCRTTLQRSII